VKNLSDILEKIFAILSLTFFTGGLSFGGTVPTGPVTTLRYVIWFISGLLLLLRWRTTLATAKRDFFIWIVTVMAVVSFTWSAVPAYVLESSREVLQMTFFGLYFAGRFSLKEQLQLVAWTLGIGAIASIFVAVLVPSIGVHGADHPGAWRGIYDYKNTLGSMMTLSMVAFYLLGTNKEPRRLFAWCGFGLSLLLMLLSTSKTSVTMTLLLLLIIVFYRQFKWQGKITILILDLTMLFLGGIGLVVFTNWVTILTGMGKDPTLTGRTGIWGVALTRLHEHLLLGFGRGAFWAPGSKNALEAGLAVSLNFIPPHVHNGFIDLALDIGLIGFICFAISFVLVFWRALKQGYATKATEELWPLVFLIYLAMNNVTESYLLRLANIYWVLLLVAIFSVRQGRRAY
jgi:exopolysaccharide production protein ExoQ